MSDFKDGRNPFTVPDIGKEIEESVRKAVEQTTSEARVKSSVGFEHAKKTTESIEDEVAKRVEEQRRLNERREEERRRAIDKAKLERRKAEERAGAEAALADAEISAAERAKAEADRAKANAERARAEAEKLEHEAKMEKIRKEQEQEEIEATAKAEALRKAGEAWLRIEKKKIALEAAEIARKVAEEKAAEEKARADAERARAEAEAAEKWRMAELAKAEAAAKKARAEKEAAEKWAVLEAERLEAERKANEEWAAHEAEKTAAAKAEEEERKAQEASRLAAERERIELEKKAERERIEAEQAAEKEAEAERREIERSKREKERLAAESERLAAQEKLAAEKQAAKEKRDAERSRRSEERREKIEEIKTKLQGASAGITGKLKAAFASVKDKFNGIKGKRVKDESAGGEAASVALSAAKDGPWRHIRLPIWLSIVLIPLFAALTTAAVAVLQSGNANVVWDSFASQPLKLWFNFLPVLATTAILSVAMNNTFVGGALNLLTWSILAYANQVKVSLRDDPLVMEDLKQVREAFYAMGDFNIGVNGAVMFFVIIMALLFALAGIFVWNSKINPRIRIGVLVILLVSSVIVEERYYNSNNMASRQLYYQTFEHSSDASRAVRFDENGFVFSFLHSRNFYGFAKPESYSASEAEGYERAFEAEVPAAPKGMSPRTSDKLPHVIMVMNEAWSDLSNHALFNYADPEDYPEGSEIPEGVQLDPLANLNRLAASENAIVGHIEVPNACAGTANTEFDVMTGVSTRMIANGSIPFFSVRKPTTSIASIAKEYGYSTSFTHPGRNWYYNRQNVYDYFGFDELSFYDSYDTENLNGKLVSDESVGERIISDFEKKTAEGDGPVLEFAVTIQNHMPYTLDRYGRWTEEPVNYAPVDASLSKDAADYLGIYIEGAKAGDELLGTLTSYFAEKDEPVVLVYWGDHLPSLGDNFKVYRELGIGVGETERLGDVLITYETPYVIWENDAAMELCDLSEYKELNPYEDINANYLGATLLDIIGLGQADPYFSFLNALKKAMPLYYGDIAISANGSSRFEEELPDEEGTMIFAEGEYGSRRGDWVSLGRHIAEPGYELMWRDELSDECKEALEKLANWGYHRLK